MEGLLSTGPTPSSLIYKYFNHEALELPLQYTINVFYKISIASFIFMLVCVDIEHFPQDYVEILAFPQLRLTGPA